MFTSLYLYLRTSRISTLIYGYSSQRIHCNFNTTALLHYSIVPLLQQTLNMASKRKRSSVAPAPVHGTPVPPPIPAIKPPAPKRQESRQGKVDTNPDHNADIMDGKLALGASPDADEKGETLDVNKINAGPQASAKPNVLKGTVRDEDSDSPLSDLELEIPNPTPAKKAKKSPTKSSIAAKKGSDEIKAFKAEQVAKNSRETKIKKEGDADEWEKRVDPDGDIAGPVEDVDIMKKEAARPPPVNSDYLPLPWKGRLGYVRFIFESSVPELMIDTRHA